MVDQIDGPIAFLEYTGPNEESFGAFNKESEGGVEEGDRCIEEGEYINLRAERRTYQRRKRRERIPNDHEEILVGEVGPDLGFDETDVVDKSLKGKVVGG
ncbi:hypothetical protein R3W88_026560 [Solanum pinnatisectum]|uniref:Uncharacterized protein n=1 Tax=Solanum pinnatisectum TaxID=50273 RepID=A0AAV9LDU3_9SOLN|nr:hypothetical protein R3W88_026560 [Solanum pinnatisectum]